MTRSPCHDAFVLAQAARRTVPLQSGAYKLRESQNAIQRIQDTLHNIADHLGEEQILPIGRHNLGCCMSDEIDYYLKELPIIISALVAYDILPAIKALTNDGIPKGVLVSEMKSASANVSRLLHDCEAIHRRLTFRVAKEYSPKEEYSAVNALLIDAFGIAERALQLFKWIKMRHRPIELSDAFLDWDLMVQSVLSTTPRKAI